MKPLNARRRTLGTLGGTAFARPLSAVSRCVQQRVHRNVPKLASKSNPAEICGGIARARECGKHRKPPPRASWNDSKTLIGAELAGCSLSHVAVGQVAANFAEHFRILAR